MPPLDGPAASGRYWCSLDELAHSPEFRRFVAAEFPSLWDRFSTGPDGSTRRQFLKVMGASLALTGCRWPKETIVPATKQPGDRIPGVTVQYATAMELGGVATGLLVTSYDGRPIKIEGNEKHPFSRGKTNAWLQASLLELYDLDRSEWPVERRAQPGAAAKLAAALLAGGLAVPDGGTVPPELLERWAHLPLQFPFIDALAKVKTRIHLGLYDDERSQACTWHLPRAHFLEAWSDALAYDGTLGIIQPLITPLYDGRTAVELLALLTQDRMSAGHDIVRRTFGNAYDFGVNREQLWSRALEDGLVADSRWPASAPALSGQRAYEWLAALASQPAAAVPDRWEIVFRPDYKLYDGRFANNAWLQELPDPITKLTWDNAALMSPADAERLGIQTNGDLVRIELEGRSVEMPVYIVPGHAAGSLTLPLGYGPGPAAGKVADGAGFDAYKLRTTAALHAASGAQVTATGRHYPLATTQDRPAIDSQIGREEVQERIGVLVREATLKEYQDHPRFAEHVVHLPPLESLWQEKQYTGHKWGMAIDLSACIGCGACIVACQAENNVPVVGKDEVARGREMQWIRVDRYFRGGTEGLRDSGTQGADGKPLNPEVVHQPVTCVHCENAPCEQVCPVAATVHDAEGLNVQVYNRCVGTRYCANNCPYKVRRFNWFYNHHGPCQPRSRNGQAFHLPAAAGKLKQVDLTDMKKMVNNPNVTVRSRGVMEKCSFCVQRINAVKIKAKNERWDGIPDGLITPACAQACPTGAIVFGDLNDPNSRVRKLHAHDRAYFMLAELNLRPRTAYLAKLRNPAETQA